MTVSTSLKKALIDQIIPALLKKIDPGALLRKKIHFRNKILVLGDARYRLTRDHSLYVIGAGKGSARMAVEMEKILGSAITDGVVVTRYGYGLPSSQIRIIEARHPLPDRAGEGAARELLSLAARARKGDLIIGLWSGGGSALLPAPVAGVTLWAKQKATDLLLKSGADIVEINTVRKHLSQIKGGGLAKVASPASMLNLILSDVVGDRLDVVASGPTAPDPTTFSEAIEVLKRYDLWTKVDRSIRVALGEGRRGIREETPKPQDPLWRRVHHVLIGNGEVAVEEAAHRIAAIGFRPKILTSFLEGEAQEVAKVWVALAKQEIRKKRRGEKPICLLGGGETAVTVRGKGRGGRCQEFALSAAVSMSGTKEMVAAAFSTDGTDGPTSAAGAISDGETVRRAAAKGLDARQALSENNAYPFFQSLGDLIETGPTRTHLNDLYFVFIV